MNQLQDKQTLFYILLVASLILARLPYVGIYFRVINTLVHESGHAFVALLTSGKLSRIELFADSSGTATTVSKSKLANFLISFAGYPISSITAYVFFRLIRFEHYDFVLYIIAFLTVVNIIFFVRNKYGIFWLITFGIILAGILYFDKILDVLNIHSIFLIHNYLKYWSAIFFSCVILTDSVVSALILLKLSFKNGKKAGDATNLKSYSYIPSFIWSLIFVAIAVYFFYLSAILYFPAISSVLDKCIVYVGSLIRSI